MDIKQLQQKLETLENDISNAEKKKANLEGKQESILEKLKNEFNISNIDNIDVYIKDNESKIIDLEKEIEVNFKELENFDLE